MKLPTFGKKKLISIFLFLFVIFLCIAFSEYINYFMNLSMEQLEYKYAEGLKGIPEEFKYKLKVQDQSI